MSNTNEDSNSNESILLQLKNLTTHYKKDYNPIDNIKQHEAKTKLENGFAPERIKNNVYTIIEKLSSFKFVVFFIVSYLFVVYPLSNLDINLTLFGFSIQISKYFIEINTIVKTFGSYLATIVITHFISKETGTKT